MRRVAKLAHASFRGSTNFWWLGPLLARAARPDWPHLLGTGMCYNGAISPRALAVRCRIRGPKPTHSRTQTISDRYFDASSLNPSSSEATAGAILNTGALTPNRKNDDALFADFYPCPTIRSALPAHPFADLRSTCSLQPAGRSIPRSELAPHELRRPGSDDRR